MPKEHTALDIEALDVSATSGVCVSREFDQYGKVPGGHGMPITFQALTYSMPSNVAKNEKAFLLKDITGAFYPGQMSALVCPWPPHPCTLSSGCADGPQRQW